MLTNQQRAKFFTMSHAAYTEIRPGTPYEAWRKTEMESIGLPASTKQMDPVWHFERAMYHWCELAGNTSGQVYWSDAAKRRLEWMFEGFMKDLDFLAASAATSDAKAYLEGIIEQSKVGVVTMDRDAIRKLCAIIDTQIRRSCKDQKVAPSSLPTAGRPWCFRGKKQHAVSAFIGT